MVGDPLQHPQELAADVLEVLPAFAQVGVLDRGEALGELARGLVHGPLGVDLLVDDPALDLVEEHAVGEQQRVGVEDRRQLLAEEVARLGPRALDLLLGGAAGRLEPANLGFGLVRRDRDAEDLERAVRDHHRAADRDARARRAVPAA